MWQGTRPAPVRATCALGMFAYGIMLAGWPRIFRAGIYDPARNVMPLAIWGTIMACAAMFAMLGVYFRPMAWRAVYGAPLSIVMLTWGALQAVSIGFDGFSGDTVPGAIPLWATLNGMYLAAFLHDLPPRKPRDDRSA